MCFSANVSFGAGIVLAVIGIASIKKAKNRSQVFFSCIPLIFSVQQITEGILWLALRMPGYGSLQQSATYIYLFFAQVVWPIYIPLSILLLEKRADRKKIQKIFVATGALVSLYLAFCLLSYPVEAKIIGYHISYVKNYPAAIKSYCELLYAIATIVSPFFSGIKRMWWLGVAIFITYITTTIFYTGYSVSVWCFFASAISLVVLMIIYEINRQNKTTVNVNLQPV